MAVVAGGTLLLTGVDAGGSYAADLLPGLLVSGLGLGVAVVAVAVSVLTGAEPDETGMLSGLNTTGHEIGGSLGVAVLTTIAAGSAAGPGPRERHRRRVPRRERAGRRREPARACDPALGHELPAEAPARPARVRPLMPPARQPQRADAQRSIARILDAAIDALASDPEASMAAIARRAGVVRATIYVHFPTREALIAAITERGLAEVSAAIESAEPARGEPAEALERVITAAWRALGRFHALVEINTRLAQADLHALHAPVLDILVPLIQRGQRDGAFRADVPATWHLATLLALIHAASGELSADRIAADEVEPALRASVLGALR